MRVAVVYVYPMNGANDYFDLAFRFVHGYNEFHPGIEHETVIVCNGAPVTDETRFLFGSMQNPSFIQHDNSGFDVGAYQAAARNSTCDMMVFFGASTYLKRSGWLARMVQSYQRHGNGLYGAMGNRGVMHAGVQPHIRSTAFWMSPALLNQYPNVISRPEQRYPFEHGANCLTTWVQRRGLMAWVVSWDGEFQQPQWDYIPNGYHRGDQSNLLAGDRMTEPPYHPVP